MGLYPVLRVSREAWFVFFWNVGQKNEGGASRNLKWLSNRWCFLWSIIYVINICNSIISTLLILIFELVALVDVLLFVWECWHRFVVIISELSISSANPACFSCVGAWSAILLRMLSKFTQTNFTMCITKVRSEDVAELPLKQGISAFWMRGRPGAWITN